MSIRFRTFFFSLDTPHKLFAMAHPNLLTATRKPLDITLQVKEGNVPEDMNGFVFINSGAGSINSDGLPFPMTLPDGSPNPEYGSPVINGDGYVFRLDLTEKGKIKLKTDILKTPCYYADVGTSPIVNTKDNRFWNMAFKNFGLARISTQLGTRDQVNTAFTPFKLPNDNQSRILATFDAGRPFEFDPAQIKLITPIGKNTFWQSGMPPFMKQPIAMVLTTAHPVYDPDTKEVFTVNFTKTTKALMEATTIFDRLLPDDLEKTELDLLGKVEQWEQREQNQDLYLEVENFFKDVYKRIDRSWIGKFFDWVGDVFYKYIGHYFTHKNNVFLIRWQGEKDLKSWRILDPEGQGIQINHNMHQIGFSKDYVLLADTNFKFSFDIMINNPFPHNPRIDAFLRRLISGVMEDYSTLYIVNRKDLDVKKKNVKAKRVVLPVETVHFSANYANPNGIVTVHTAHNCSACPAEWIRNYDILKATGERVDKERLGLISVGEMDIGKIGKCVIDVNKGELIDDQTKFLYLTGDLQKPDTGPHTWAVGLYTYREMLSPDRNIDKIEYVYWQSYGLSKQMLTEFIYNLYKSPKRHRTFSAEEMLEFTKQEAPFVLECVDTNIMEATDYYLFPKDYFMWSLQFIPRSVRNNDIPEQKDGYILCTVITTIINTQGTKEYNSEIWIFDANNLKQGAVCKLEHPELTFAFTIHSVWVPDAKSVSQPSYVLNIKDDYNAMIQKMGKKYKAEAQQLFDEYVYPNFNN